MPTGKEILDFFSIYYSQYGYLIIGTVLLLDNIVVVGLLLPSELLITMGGYFARQGDFSLPLMLVVGYLGMMIGQSIAYFIGEKGLQYFLIRWGFGEQLQSANTYFTKYGMTALIFASFAGSTRAMLSVVIGSSNVTYKEFLVWESLAAIIWVCAFSFLGYFLGYNQTLIEWIVGNVGKIAPTVLIVWVIITIYQRKWGKSK